MRSSATNQLSADSADAAASRGQSVPIADYGLLSDCNSAALVSRAGSVDWLCLPRYDSPAVFARLLGPDAGHWSIRPTGSFQSSHRYLEGTLVLETTFATDTGTVKLTDALSFQRGHDLGLDSPHELLRLVEGVSGAVELELAPRPEYGLVRPLFQQTADGGRTFGGPSPLAISAGVPVGLDGGPSG
jgi:alpha,alpha-trehalase